MDSSREKDRDRSKRGDRPSRFSDAERDRSNDRTESKRLYVSNIPFEYTWSQLKDLFKEKVGDVAYVELFNDENGKPKGCGVVEFNYPENVKTALSVMHRYQLNGRKLIVKEETASDRRKARTFSKNRNGGGGGRNIRENNGDCWGATQHRDLENYEMYGLNMQFLDSISVQPPLGKKLFVANLDYKADRNKIKEIFKMAGKVRNIDLAVDKDGNSKGFAVIEYDHPVEAVQAISMFDKQTLYERRMSVRMDKGSREKTELRLPEGLKSIGVGLGPNGEPLRDVARSVTQPQAQVPGGGVAPALPSAVMAAPPAVALNGLGTSLAANSLNTTSALGGGLGLQALGLTGLGALQNQLLQQGLTASDLTQLLTAHASVNQANLGLTASDLGSSMLGNSALGNSLMGNNSLSSGQLSGNSRQMSSLPSGQGYGREPALQQTANRDKVSDMVVITNLPPTVTWQLIREKFSECGEVKFAEMTAPDTAIVRFLKEWDAERAIKMFDRTRIDGRSIAVRFF